MRRIRIAGILVLGTLVALSVGCGGSGTRVQGKLVQGGKPINVSEKGLVIMNFNPEEGKDSYSAEVGKDGTFTVKGKEGAGIPTGKYNVVIRWYDPYTGMETDADRLGGKFAQGKGIPVTVEAGKDVVIDLNNPKSGS